MYFSADSEFHATTLFSRCGYKYTRLTQPKEQQHQKLLPQEYPSRVPDHSQEGSLGLAVKKDYYQIGLVEIGLRFRTK